MTTNSLTPTSKVELLSEYERLYGTEDHLLFGWNIWPFLRLWLGWRLFRQAVPPSGAEPRRTNASPRTRLGERLSNYRKALTALTLPYRVPGRRVRPDVPAVDAVILTRANRREQVGDASLHPVADALSWYLAERGLSARIWEAGDPRWRRHHPSSLIDGYLCSTIIRANRRSRSARASEPEWFAPFEEWATDRLGFCLPWPEVYRQCFVIEAIAGKFREWLERSGSRALFIDAWYGQLGMAASLAATRLGLPHVDVQHGIQGPTHFAYSRWAPPGEGTYAALPNAFWFWGEAAARAFAKHNQLDALLIVGGNPWMERWARGTDARLEMEVDTAVALTAGSARTVLVTLQPITDLAALEQVIRRSPSDWCWLLRLHRGWLNQIRQVETMAAELDGHRVIVREATDMPLYALMRVADVHMTGASTCALEALSFGLPTVLLQRGGVEIFGTYVDAGVMLDAAGGMDSFDAILACAEIDPTRCLQLSEECFAPAARRDAVVETLLTANGP